MMFIENWNWGDAFTRSLIGVWDGVISFLPDLIFALVIFAIGWILAALVERLVEAVFRSLKIDAALKSAGFEEVVKRAGHNLNSGLFVGALVKWFVIVVFLIASFDVLRLSQVNQFLIHVVDYLPSVIVAVLVLMIAVVIANTIQKIVVASARAAHIHAAELLGRIAKWAIWVSAFITALSILGIAPFLEQIISNLVMGVALAVGLAFGLGGKEVAQRWIEKTTHVVTDKE